jgi:class 3 adenylate cyclase
MQCPTCHERVSLGWRFCPQCGATVSAAKAHERRRVSVVFVDLVASTKLAKSLKSDEYFDLMGEILTVLAGEIEALEGQVLQFQGDAVLAVFGALNAHEDDTLRALKAARAAINAVRAYGARIGIELEGCAGIDTDLATTGWVGGEYTVFGSVVNLARRLASAANPGEVMVSSRSRMDTWQMVEYEPVIGLEVRDYGDEAGPFKLRSFRPLPEALPGTVFVGRNEELGRLERLLERTRNLGMPLQTEIVGGLGSGKTRLITEFTKTFDALPDDLTSSQPWHLNIWPGQGVGKLALKLVPFEATINLEALNEYLTGLGLKDIAPGVALALGMAVTGYGQRPWDALADLIIQLAKRRPLVLSIERPHQLEPEIFALVRRLEKVNAGSILIVRLQARASGDTSEVIRLEAMNALEGCTMLENCAGTISIGTARHVYESSAGNPLMLEVLGRALSASENPGQAIPDTVQRAIMSKLDCLSLDAREVLSVASLSGTSFFSSALEQILARPIGLILERLALDGWIEEKPTQFVGEREFVMPLPLVRDVAAALNPARVWKAAHASLSHWFLERDPVRAAEHHRLSGESREFGFTTPGPVQAIEVVQHDLLEMSLEGLVEPTQQPMASPGD